MNCAQCYEQDGRPLLKCSRVGILLEEKQCLIATLNKVSIVSIFVYVTFFYIQVIKCQQVYRSICVCLQLLNFWSSRLRDVT